MKHPAKPPQEIQPQLAFDIFRSLGANPVSIVDAPSDVGYDKSRCLIDVSGLSVQARRVINAFYYTVRNSGPAQHMQKTWQLPLPYFKWLVAHENSNNLSHLKASIKEAQKAQVTVSIIDGHDGGKDRWASVPMLGAVLIADGLVSFRIPEELLGQIHSPDRFSYLSLRISNSFSSVYASNLYERLLEFRALPQPTEWVELDLFRSWMGVSSTKTYQEYPNLRRFIIDPAIKQINAQSDLSVTYDTRSAAGSRKVTHLRFSVGANPDMKKSYITRNQDLMQMYSILREEFGFSEEDFRWIAEHQSAFTPDAIQAAIDFTRHRMEQEPRKIRYPGKYLKKALSDGLAIPTSEKWKEKAAPPAKPAGAAQEQAKPAGAAQEQAKTQILLGKEKWESLNESARTEVMHQFRASPVGRLHRNAPSVFDDDRARDALFVFLANRPADLFA